MKTNQSLMALFVDNYIYPIIDIFPLLSTVLETHRITKGFMLSVICSICSYSVFIFGRTA